MYTSGKDGYPPLASAELEAAPYTIVHSNNRCTTSVTVAAIPAEASIAPTIHFTNRISICAKSDLVT